MTLRADLLICVGLSILIHAAFLSTSRQVDGSSGQGAGGDDLISLRAVPESYQVLADRWSQSPTAEAEIDQPAAPSTSLDPTEISPETAVSRLEQPRETDRPNLGQSPTIDLAPPSTVPRPDTAPEVFLPSLPVLDVPAVVPNFAPPDAPARPRQPVLAAPQVDNTPPRVEVAPPPPAPDPPDPEVETDLATAPSRPPIARPDTSPEPAPTIEVSEIATGQSPRPQTRPDRAPPEAPDEPPQPAPSPALAPQTERIAEGTGGGISRGEDLLPVPDPSIGPALAAAEFNNLLSRWSEDVFRHFARMDPQAPDGASGVVRLNITLSRSGRLLGVALVSSSGNDALDRLAISLVRSSGGVPAPVADPAEPPDPAEITRPGFPAAPAGFPRPQYTFVTNLRFSQ